MASDADPGAVNETKESVATPPAGPAGAASPSPDSSTPPTFARILRDFFFLFDTQMRIWRLRARGRFVSVCLSAAFFIGMLALAARGFVLFDEALGALLRVNRLWFSPLVRGCLYLGIAGYAFYIMYVYAAAAEDELPPEPSDDSPERGKT